MKMVKLAEDHYIMVDDSEITTGDIVAEKLLTGEYELFTIHTLNDIDKSSQKKITYSTQPESLGVGWMQSVQPLFLSEVKELLGVVDKAFERYPVIENDKDHNDRNYYRRSAYYQALEDNKEKKYTEEDMRKAYYQGHKSGLGSENGLTFEYTLQSLQPTEWEVEMVDGKLKLKQ